MTVPLDTQRPDISTPVQPPGIAVVVDEVSKVYRVYQQPQDRLKEMLFSRFGQQYGRDFWALRDVSFTLARGERLGVIGRNGSGKSTLLQILAGTLAPSGGRVETNGRVAALLELGSGFNPEYTGRENVYINASILGLTRPQIDERFDAIAAFADIGEFLDQPVKTYSSGMFVRLAFSVVTSVDADVLLIDEALAVGDIFFTQKCYRHLESLIDRGVAIILVTHDTAAVSQFCSQTLVLDRGRLIFLGDTTRGIRTYFSVQREVSAQSHRLTRGSAAGGSAGADAHRRDGNGFAVWSGQAWPGPGWPGPEESLSLDRIVPVGGGGHCTFIALTDEYGQACHTFEIGQAALFHAEFVVAQDIGVPVVGVELFNERNINVHGKNSLQHGALAPNSLRAGDTLRMRQRIVLDVSPGTYTFGLGLATIDAKTYAHVEAMSYPMLADALEATLIINNAGAFSVITRKSGQALPHHGLCDLPGDVRLAVVDAERGLRGV